VQLGSSSDWSGVGLLTKEKIQNESDEPLNDKSRGAGIIFKGGSLTWT